MYRDVGFPVAHSKPQSPADRKWANPAGLNRGASLWHLGVTKVAESPLVEKLGRIRTHKRFSAETGRCELQL